MSWNLPFLLQAKKDIQRSSLFEKDENLDRYDEYYKKSIKITYVEKFYGLTVIQKKSFPYCNYLQLFTEFLT